MNDFGNNYEFKNSLNFFKRHWKLLTCVFVIAAVVSVVASLMVTPRFKSSAILFPTSSNRLSNTFFAIDGGRCMSSLQYDGTLWNWQRRPTEAF